MRAVVVLVAVMGCDFTRLAPLDAAAPDDALDAPPDTGSRAFDPTTECAASYTESLPLTTAGSRYRVIATPATFWVHYATCNADASSHMVVLDTAQEIRDLTARLAMIAPATPRYYIGLVQDPAATAVGAGWISLDGEPVVPGLWYTLTGVPEPNDLDDGMENGGQQLGILDIVETYLQDATGGSAYPVICECDGVAIAATAQAFVDADPNHPP